jgi:murein DD-endopeptidase MepM/ murein hydrolase activator NlpD
MEGGTTTCDPFEPQITFSRPTSQDSGQADGTGTGSYDFFDNDTQTYVYVPPIIGAVSSGGDGGPGGPPGGPPPSGDCLACPILDINNLGYQYCEATFYGDDHRGTDYIADPGTPLYAVIDGNITFSGWGQGYGYQVTLAGSDGNTYIYAHMDGGSMPSTGPVTANQQIGAVGDMCLSAGDPNVPGCTRTNSACASANTGSCTNGTTSIAHLHFEARPPGVGYGVSCTEQYDPQELTPSECMGSCAGSGACTGGSSTINCDPNATFDPSLNNVKPVPELIAAVMNTGYAAQTDYDHIEMCYNDVISRAQAANLDPALAMAIWIEESGASNYCMFPTVADFGCIFVTRANFSLQLNCLVGIQQSYATYGGTFAECRDAYCPPGVSELTVLKYFQTYSGGPGACVNNNFGANPNFYDQITDFYQIVHADDLAVNDFCVLPSNDWSVNCSPVSSCTLYP